MLDEPARHETERGMKQKTSLPAAYRVIRLIDLHTPHPEIAACTGLTEDDVRAIEAWVKAFENLSPQTRGSITATEALVLWYFRYVAAITAPDGQMLGVFGAESHSRMVQDLGAETTSEIAEVVESIRGKNFLDPLIGTVYQDILPGGDEDGDDPDPEEPEVELLDPSAWEGPPSRLLAELLDQDLSGELERDDKTNLFYILSKDTLRILMDTGEFIAILGQMIKEPGGAWEDARWPHSGPIYIELSEAAPQLPAEYLGSVHSFIISEEYRDDIRGVMIPNTREDGPGTITLGLNTKTGAITGLFGPETLWDQAILLARGLVAFVTDVNYEFVEMPLSRRARRRLQRSGQPNPWHVVRRRKGG